MFVPETAMDNSNRTGQGNDSLLQPIDQLELVMADVESFLTHWLGRLEQLHELSATPDALLRKRLRDFELEKTQWDAKRKRETQDIHDKSEELAKAWLRLEQEQRSFQQTRDSHSHSTRTAAVETRPTEQRVASESTESKSTTEPGAPTPVAAEEPNLRRPSPLQGNRAGATAVRQFEQLRREIQISRRQTRRV
jgi:hypothetical protein